MKYCFLFLALVSTILLTSCKEDMDFTYDNIPPIYVAEGTLTNLSAQVIVSQSIDMDDSTKRKPLSDARVTLSGTDGTTAQLHHTTNGVYADSTSFHGVPGVEYTLSIQLGDDTFTSSSTMQKEVSLDSIWFTWYEGVHAKEQLVMHILYTDIKDEPNTYLYRMYRNGKIYKWGLMKDQGRQNTQIDKIAVCVSKQTIEDNDEDDREKILYEGDKIQLNLYAIDTKTYDYLLSLNLSTSNGSNAYEDFTSSGSSAMLGYFMAASVSTLNTVVHFNDIKPEQ